MPKAYSYLRFSTPEQSKGDSLRRQIEKAKEYATRHGLELDDSLTLEDKGISAFKGANATRGALRRFLDAIDVGIVEPGSVLLVENLDRMSRQDPWDALPTFQQIINAGVSIVTVQDGRVWSREELRANPIRIMESLFVMIRANEESATKSRRLKAVNEAKRAKAREQGKLLTRRIPAWLKVNEDTQAIEVIPERAGVVREIFRWASEGIGKEAIARRLNERSEATFGDAEFWRKSYIDRILNNPAVIGTMVPRTRDIEQGKTIRKAQEPIEGYFPAVIDKDIFQTIETFRKTRAPKGRFAAQSATSVFAGLTTCALCGSSFVRVNKGQHQYLVCSKASAKGGCEYLAQPYGKLEAGLKVAMPFILEELPRGGDTKALEKTIEKLRIKQEEQADQLSFFVDEYGKKRSAALRNKIDSIESELSDLGDQIEQLTKERESRSSVYVQRRIERLKEAVKTWEPHEVNLALRENIKEMKVDPRNARVDVQWQTGDWMSEGFRFETKHAVWPDS